MYGDGSQINEHKYVYIFIRKDIPLSHQMAQACHGALEAGKHFPDHRHKTDSIIVIGVKNKQSLIKARNLLTENDIRSIEFHEPDWEYGLTTFGTQPISHDQRHHMRKYRLWNA